MKRLRERGSRALSSLAQTFPRDATFCPPSVGGQSRAGEAHLHAHTDSGRRRVGEDAAPTSANFIPVKGDPAEPPALLTQTSGSTMDEWSLFPPMGIARASETLGHVSPQWVSVLFALQTCRRESAFRSLWSWQTRTCRPPGRRAFSPKWATVGTRFRWWKRWDFGRTAHTHAHLSLLFTCSCSMLLLALLDTYCRHAEQLNNFNQLLHIFGLRFKINTNLNLDINLHSGFTRF